MTAELDHVVLAVPDLGRAVRELTDRTGVEPAHGGAHPGLGTHNALVGMTWRGGTRCYLELLAPDPDQPGVPAAATMLGLGLLGDDFEPRMLAWAVRPDDLEATVARARREGVDVGAPAAASRTTTSGRRLTWQLAVPRPLGLGGVQPFLIDWGRGPHPADELAPSLELLGLELRHPDPATAARRLAVLGVDHPVGPAGTPSLGVTLRTPAGEVVLT